MDIAVAMRLRQNAGRRVLRVERHVCLRVRESGHLLLSHYAQLVVVRAEVVVALQQVKRLDVRVVRCHNNQPQLLACSKLLLYFCFTTT